ncbi:MAG: beta-galactosidase [Muribaculaceae bacterium]|nr:beta-galactosidase [Muribaculaceae bacterium]
MAGADGDRYIDSHVWPTLQTSPGVYDPVMLRGLDNLLARLEERRMKAVVYLNNAWEWSGGYGTYLEWSGHGAAPVPLRDGYDRYMQHVARFTTDSTALAMFHDHVRHIVGRVNSVTGRPYSESPAIMSWQIANEPRCFDPDSKEAFAGWIESTAALIKSIDPNHLVSTGSEGSHGCEGDIDLWARIHNSPDIDYANVHVWPYNWGWADPSDLEGTLPTAQKNTLDYISRHSRLTGKPIVLEEFGFPRDGMAITPGSSATARDAYFEYVFGLVGDGAPLAGINFWGWGGEARPAHRSWQPGDDYCGDPAQEDQGLNSVFDNDTATLCVIRHAASRLRSTAGK